jgi:surface antigen
VFGRASSYTGHSRRSKRARLFGVAAAWAAAWTAAASLAACSSFGPPLGERNAGRLARTASITPAAAQNPVETVDPSDWETIRRAVAASSDATAQTLTWRNPDTGSNGSVALLPAISKDGSFCRSFAATVNDIRGIHRYGGDACLRTDGRWQLRHHRR